MKLRKMQLNMPLWSLVRLIWTWWILNKHVVFWTVLWDIPFHQFFGKGQKGLSAGRVQSVALKLIIDRENDIKAFVPKEYWSIDGLFKRN